MRNIFVYPDGPPAYTDAIAKPAQNRTAAGADLEAAPAGCQAGALNEIAAVGIQGRFDPTEPASLLVAGIFLEDIVAHSRFLPEPQGIP